MKLSNKRLSSTGRPWSRWMLMVWLVACAFTLPSSSSGEETSKPVPCMGPVQLTCEDARNLDAYVVKLETELTALKVPPPLPDCGSSNSVVVGAVSAAVGVLAGILVVVLVQ